MKITLKPTDTKLPPIRVDLNILADIEAISMKYYNVIEYKSETSTQIYSFSSVEEMKSIEETCFYTMDISLGEYPHPISIKFGDSSAKLSIATDNPLDLGVAEKLKSTLANTASKLTKILYHDESVLIVPFSIALVFFIFSFPFIPLQISITIASMISLIVMIIITVKLMKFSCYSIIYLKKKPLSLLGYMRKYRKILFTVIIGPIIVAGVTFLLEKFVK